MELPVAELRQRLLGEKLVLVATVLFAAGVAVRLWFMVAGGPAFLGYPDSAAYIIASRNPLGGTELEPAGYPLFLWLVHLVSARLWWTIGLQHVLGVAIAVLYFLLVRRVAGVKWVALVVAAVVLFDGMELFFEHAVMSEVVAGLAIAFALYAVVSLPARQRQLPWLAAAGASLGVAGGVRIAALPLVLVVVLWLWVVRRNDRRFISAAVVGASALAILAAFVISQHQSSGVWGLSRSDGFDIYQRVSTFADCSKFRPPAGTEVLCARKPPPPQLYRSSPFLWACPGIPGICRFGDPPGASSKLRAFALTAIVNQPSDYLNNVGRDFLRYFRPPRYYTTNDLLKLLDNPVNEAPIVAGARRFYWLATPFGTDRAGLNAYARVVHISGIGLAVLLAGAVLSVFLTAGESRQIAILLAAVGLLLLLIPVAALHYEPRFGLPATAPLAAASALALSAAVARYRVSGRRL